MDTSETSDGIGEARDALTRREVLAKAGIAVLTMGAAPALLAERAAASPAFRTAQEKVGGSIYFLSFQGYDFPTTMKAWKKAEHVTVKATYVSTNDDVPAKVLRGNVPYDFTALYQGYTSLWTSLGILEPFDPAKVPNIKHLFPFFRSKYGNFWVLPNGDRIGVPFSWGFQSLTFDASAAPGLSSFAELLSPKFKGKVAMPDDPAGMVSIACAVLHINPARMTAAQFARVQNWWKMFLPQTRGISPTYGDVVNRLVSGDAVAAICGYPALNSMAAGSGKKTVKTIIAKEGGFAYTNAWAILKTSKNQDTVAAWANQTCVPKQSAANMDFLLDASPVMGARALQSKDSAALYPPGGLGALIKKVPLLLLPPTKSTQYVTYAKVIDAWQKVKAGA